MPVAAHADPDIVNGCCCCQWIPAPLQHASLRPQQQHAVWGSSMSTAPVPIREIRSAFVIRSTMLCRRAHKPTNEDMHVDVNCYAGRPNHMTPAHHRHQEPGSLRYALQYARPNSDLRRMILRALGSAVAAVEHVSCMRTESMSHLKQGTRLSHQCTSSCQRLCSTTSGSRHILQHPWRLD